MVFNYYQTFYNEAYKQCRSILSPLEIFESIWPRTNFTTNTSAWMLQTMDARGALHASKEKKNYIYTYMIHVYWFLKKEMVSSISTSLGSFLHLFFFVFLCFFLFLSTKTSKKMPEWDSQWRYIGLGKISDIFSYFCRYCCVHVT